MTFASIARAAFACVATVAFATVAEAQCKKCDFEGYGGSCMVGPLANSFTDCQDWGPFCANTGDHCPGSGPVSSLPVTLTGGVSDRPSVQVKRENGTTELRTCYGALVESRKSSIESARELSALTRITI
jgi:hypothetical protein